MRLQSFSYFHCGSRNRIHEAVQGGDGIRNNGRSVAQKRSAGIKGTLGIEISPDAGAWIILGATLNAISSANRLLGGLEEIEAVVPGPLTFREHSISPGSDPPISCTIAFILTASCIWQNEPKLFDSDQTFQAPRALWFRAVVTIGGYKATCATTDVLARRLPRFHERHFENG
jgi:hypothetical protein